MEVEYSLTPEDLIAFARYHEAHAAAARGRSVVRIILPCLFLLVTVSTLFLLFAGLRRGQVPVEVWMLPGAVLLAPVILLLMSRSRARSIRKLLREGQNAKKMLGKQRLVLTADGIARTSEFGASTTNWKGIEKIGVTADHAFFYVSTTTAFVVPKHAFAGETAFLRFVQAAEDYWAAARRE